MNLNSARTTCITTHQVGAVAQRRIVEVVVALCHCVFVTDPHCQPVAAILLHLERHLHWLVTVRIQGWLHEGESVAVPLGRFY